MTAVQTFKMFEITPTKWCNTLEDLYLSDTTDRTSNLAKLTAITRIQLCKETVTAAMVTHHTHT